MYENSPQATSAFNLDDARFFLECLDPDAQAFTFQTFDDVKLPNGKSRGSRHLAQIIHGSFEDVAPRLQQLNEAGAGVFITINATDLKGRKRENISRVRAIWHDDDNAGVSRIFKLPPHLEVETSPGKRHRYWFVDDMTFDQHASVMHVMVERWGSDPKAKDLARVLRLPGFYHRKGDAHLVRVVGGLWYDGDEEVQPYTTAQILAAFPPVKAKEAAPEPPAARESASFDRARLFQALGHIPADDRDIWLRVGMGLHAESGGSGDGYDLWSAWAPNAPDKFDEADQRRVWDSFRGSGITAGTIYHMARQHGWSGDGAKVFERIAAPDAPTVESVSWPVMGRQAFHGPIGELARLASAHTEIDPVAILASGLVWSGALFGRRKYMSVGDDTHHARLFAALVGASSRARKGSSLAPVRKVFQEVQYLLPEHPPLRVVSGLSTGEGLIEGVRDARDGQDTGGVEDKRTLVIESELGRVLRAATRQGNTISPVLRDAWDGVTLGVLTKTNPVKASNPHICLLGHITRSELVQLLDDNDIRNGFTNRFLFICVKRRAQIPFPAGMRDEDRTRIARAIVEAVRRLERCQPDAGAGRMPYSAEARDLYEATYSELTRDHAGVLGVVTARAEAQVHRLALLYALLDAADEIRVEHLEAALAFQQYAADSARFIFSAEGEATDPIADKILEGLSTGPKTTTELRDLFGRNLESGVLNRTLAGLQERGQVECTEERTATKPRKLWSLPTTNTTNTTYST